MIALTLYEDDICECGFHKDLHGKENWYMPVPDVCPILAAAEKYARIQADSDAKAMKQHGDDPPPGITRPSDGRRVFMKRLTEAEKQAEIERRASRGSSVPRRA